ncbi:hypothetical protein Tco_1326927 [Tanacetum coccineum]|uniref:Uncharacterized protein n=1 Tax=Tanacetum coccineum TaxID=301880 RepID=A0ABQ5H5B1_9ASTR
MEGYKLKDLKLKEFDSIQEMFDRAFKRVNTFEDFRTELVEAKEKRAGTEMIQEITKKQKVEDDKEAAKLKQLIEIIPNEEEVAIDAIPLAVKSPSFNRKSHPTNPEQLNGYENSTVPQTTQFKYTMHLELPPNDEGSKNGFFKILKGNKISMILKALKAEDCISSSGWQLTNFVKRKLGDVYESKSDSNDDSPNQDILIINVEYADDVFRLHLPVSLATLAVVT